MASNNNIEDPFDDVLNLEDKFYSEGYTQGVADGERAGRIEGRSFGIEKGFEKFVEAGRLYGKSIVWANRLPGSSPPTQDQKRMEEEHEQRLPVLRGGGSRLEKNIVTLHALVELDTLSTENTDEAVNDFDDRVKRAQGKARVIERQIGEDSSSTAATNPKQQKREAESSSDGNSSGSKTEQQQQ